MHLLLFNLKKIIIKSTSITHPLDFECIINHMDWSEMGQEEVQDHLDDAEKT